MQITLDLAAYRNETLIALANALSNEMDDLTLRRGGNPETWTEKAGNFHVICSVLERRGVVVSDHVICPAE
jgi:hypothetical protein